VLDVRLSYVRETSPNVPIKSDWDMSQFGSAYAALSSQMSSHPLPGYSVQNGVHSLGQSGGGGAIFVNWWNNYGLTANLVKIMSKHSLKFGTELRLMDDSAIANAGSVAGTPATAQRLRATSGLRS